MAVVFDNSTSGSAFPQNLVTISGHVLGSNPDRVVLAGVCLFGPVQPSWGAAPAYGGVLMDFLGVQSVSYRGRAIGMHVYYLLDAALPAAGANNLTYESGDGPYESSAVVSSYDGVLQAPPNEEGDANFNNPQYAGGTLHTTNITLGASAGMLVDFFGMEADGGSIDHPGQTERELTTSSPYVISTDKAFASSGANSMGEEPQSNHNAYSHFLVELAEAGGTPDSNAIAFGANF